MANTSKIKKIDLAQLKILASKGFTDKELAVFFKVCEKTINVYKKDPAFIQSLKEGKAISDGQVVRSLFERACGYEHPEEKVFCHEGEIIKCMTIKKYPPDTTACIFWLKNRDPQQWRDRVEHTGADGGALIVKWQS